MHLAHLAPLPVIGTALAWAWRAVRVVRTVEEVAPIAADELRRGHEQVLGTSTLDYTPKEKPAMKLDLSNLAADMALAASAANTSRQYGQKIYAYAAVLIGAVESAYKQAGAGAHKRSAVIAAVRAAYQAAGADYAALAPEFEPWLESVIAAYNAIDSIFGDALPQAPAASTIVGAVQVAEGLAREAVGNVVADVEQVFAKVAPQAVPAGAANTQGV